MLRKLVPVCVPMTDMEIELARIFYGEDYELPVSTAQPADLFAAANLWMDEFNQYTEGLYPLDEILIMDEFGELSCLND